MLQSSQFTEERRNKLIYLLQDSKTEQEANLNREKSFLSMKEKFISGNKN